MEKAIVALKLPECISLLKAMISELSRKSNGGSSKLIESAEWQLEFIESGKYPDLSENTARAICLSYISQLQGLVISPPAADEKPSHLCINSNICDICRGASL
jgi:hypothetical protein